MKLFIRLSTLLLPLLLTPLLVFLLAEGYLNLGGGEKDILMALPWLLWSLLFLGFGIGLWKRYPGYGLWLARSVVYSLGVLILIWVALLVFTLVRYG